MIQIVVAQINKDEFCLRITGHAQSAPYGSDLVCAACSMLCITAAERLREMESQLEEPAKISMQGGDAVIYCRAKGNAIEAVKGVFQTIACGARWMSENYPEYVKTKSALQG